MEHGSSHQHEDEHEHGHSCHPQKGRPDFLLWGSLLAVVLLYGHYAISGESIGIALWYRELAATVFELMNTIWWGILLGFLMVSVLSKIPREFVLSILGSKRGFNSIFRATAAGVLLDLCSHGILMVGAKLYERGASAGQVMAFLIASPWNSFSLTLILIALIGLGWTLAFIALSMLVGISVGLLFDVLVAKKVLPENPNHIDLPEGFSFWREAKSGLNGVDYSGSFFAEIFILGLKESRMVIRWILFGVILAGLVRAFMTPEMFSDYFGASLMGLGLTLIAATIMEVCSEGSTPIAADLLTRANAPGNSFAFLMTGVSTDYTEVMVLREATGSWKLALFLPLLSVPQVVLIAWLINVYAV